MQNFTYKTIQFASEGLFKDRGSKFIAYAYSVDNEIDIKSNIELLKKEHHTARHHCWAYRIGNDGSLFRAYDDNEPTNSAGKPILGQIDACSLTNVLVVVVRYFGGTLLGVGGLMHAYKEAAKDALKNALIIEKSIEIGLTISFLYEQCNAVMLRLKQHNCKIISQSFDEVSTIICNVSKQNSELCISQLLLIPNTKIVNAHG